MTAGQETYTENIYDDEATCEIAYRKLVNGQESAIERVVAVRTHPLQMEFHQRSTVDGFRVQWDMPSSAALNSVNAFVREAQRMDSTPPTTIGYGMTSDPIRECSYDSVQVAIQTIVRQPWLVMDVVQSSVQLTDCAGYTFRKMQIASTGEIVYERITIAEEQGEVRYNKCDSSGSSPGPKERVLAVRTPLRLELYERSTSDGMRTNWSAPYDVARKTFDGIVKMGAQIEKGSGDVVGYGIASKPMTGVTEDTLWKAMLTAMKSPDKNGMKVDSVSTRHMAGFMQRSMRLLEKPGAPTVIDNIRVLEGPKELTFRSVTGGQESEEERVFALRSDPLRLEMWNRHSRDEMRLDWQAPRAVVNDIFNAVTTAAQR